jgi:NADPH:quinone reductase-like Zn-dependent oxidoreductase
MKAARFHEYGPASNVVVEEVDQPTLGESEVLVEVRASGVNPMDWKLRSGALQQWMPLELPYVGGFDLAGTVAQLGGGVTGFKVGQAVFGRGNGAFAEFAMAPQDTLAVKPEQITFEEAATIPIGAATAWAALFDGAQLQAGQSVLIHGAAGGVGMWASQIAHWKGATVYGTVSTSNVDFAKSLGIDHVIDYTTTRFEDAAHDVDAVLDTVTAGGDIPVRSLSVIKPGGVFVSISGMPPEEAAKERGVRIGTFQSKGTNALLTQIAELIVSGTLRPEVGKVYPFEEIVQAEEFSELGHGRGRVVLKVK